MVQDVLFETIRSQRKLECMVIYSSEMAMHSDSYNEQVQYCKNKTGRDKEEKYKQVLYLCQLLSILQWKKYLALNAVGMDNSII